MRKEDFEYLKREMIKDQIIKRGIKNESVLDALNCVPRHLFVRKVDQHLAYHDYPLKIEEGQTISQPYIVAQMTEALDLNKGDKVLEIGTGSGYQTAILSHLVEEIYTIERIPFLHQKAKKLLTSLDYANITLLQKDGKEGYVEEAPYDKIIVTAASQSIPKDLLDQLQDGGKMVIPIGGDNLQKLLLLEKNHTKYKEKVLGYCRFVKLI
jgi:protein-L-isoaspartate(D-aspartate) O-methyltransferase